ncbi:hypothetical protein [Rhodococcus sp. UNC23MFCrub1.1]|uniref:hypothetical protein n=1 Tax=Rhodococcus sp. UNC23MFCrub1.1 TaxID=1449068 RepID=UPI000486A783|nr:hypothetical protein [Rhodococcus sp. UNC23MFCrub1.1]
MTAVRSLVVRWTVLIAAVVLAFLPTWRRLAVEASGGAVSGYLFVVPLLAVVAGQGIARRRAGELPIHDRQTDVIVGGLGALAAVAVQALWLPRYADQYALLHIDVAAAGIFAISAAILLFGLRPVGRFWPLVVLVIALSPVLYRTVAVTLGGSRFAYGLVLVLVAGAAGGIAVGRTAARGVAGFLVTVAVGVALLRAVLAVSPTIHILWLQLIPTVGASAVAGTAFYLHARRGTTKRVLTRPVQNPSATSTRSSVLTVAVVAAVLVTLPLPNTPVPPSVAGPPGPPAATLAVPVGWRQIQDETFPWVRSFFGQGATLTRQEWQAAAVNPAWDGKGRPRTVMVDTLGTTNGASLGVYPERTLYRLSSTRTSPSLRIDLGRDITGSLYTSVDDALLLTWTKLVFEWVRGPVFQRVTVVSVDNHDPDAQFPIPEPSMASNLSALAAVFLRGNTVVGDDRPDYADADLLTTVGRDLVAAQWPPAPMGGDR